MGIPVWATEISAPASGVAAEARSVALHDGVSIVAADGPWPGIGIVIDALLGTGATGAPRDAMMPLLQRIVDLESPIIAVDGPTGLDLETGLQRGPLHAVLTVTFGGVRRGHLLARDDIGDLVVVEIGLPSPDGIVATHSCDTRWAAARVTPFRANSHKGTRGRVVIVGGSPAMVGAARLAARAAFGAGAGLVHVVAPEASLVTMREAEPDVQCMAQEFAGAIADNVRELLSRADAVAIGPGLGREAGRAEFVLAVLGHARSAVVDADALTVLKNRPRPHSPVLASAHPMRLHAAYRRVPHPLSRLLRRSRDRSVGRRSARGPREQGHCAPQGCTDRRCITGWQHAYGRGGQSRSRDRWQRRHPHRHHRVTDGATRRAAGRRRGWRTGTWRSRRYSAPAVSLHGRLRPMDVVNALPDVWRAWGRPAPVRRLPILLELPAPRTT